VGRSKRLTKLLEDTALARRVFGLLMEWAGFIEMTPAASTILGPGSGFNLDLALHVARCYTSCVAQAKMHAGRRRGRARVFDALIDFDRVGKHALDTINPGDQVPRSGWLGF
jgi:hypothetical protein